MVKGWSWLLCNLLLLSTSVYVEVEGNISYKPLPSLREQAQIRDGWLKDRISRIPALLRKHGVDAWLMSQREHAEDTIWWSIKNATDYDAHRRTILLFHTNDSVLEGKPNPVTWVDNTGQAWPELLHILESFNPRRIAINVDQNTAFAGGLHVGEYNAITHALGHQWMQRMVNVPLLGIEYVTTKLDNQLQYYRDMQDIVWMMMEEGFSHRVIRPGVTTTEDLSWWFREKMLTLNVSTWNHPRVSVLTEESFPGWTGTEDVIQKGDLLHIDWGITAMGMNTDTQHMAYVLRDGETDVPASLKQGLKKANRMQDIHLEIMRAGMTGNEVLQKCLAQMKLEGIEGQIYSHPIGDWGHDAGAVIGFTNLPKHVPVLGELTILPNTYYSIELYAYHFIPERNETIRFRIEENSYWDAETERWKFVKGRQENLYVIRESRDSTPLLNAQV
ncbi:peptidase M24, structural domain-containing protein [Lentinula raphanica]|nr:peptidase M24, structural domain-containing protein [Lentinula raphanica]